MKSQPRIKGIKRLPRVSSLHPLIEKSVERLAQRYGVSKSWVRATAIAYYFGIVIQQEVELFSPRRKSNKVLKYRKTG